MNYHIVLSRKIDLLTQNERSKQGLCPRHAMWQLAQRLGAFIHTPHDRLRLRRKDYLWSKLIGSPENWALAREIAHSIGPKTTIFCDSEAAGLPIVAFYRSRQDRPNIAVFVHNLDRPRGRVALRVLQAASHVDWFVACSQHQTDFLRQYLNLPVERATFIWHQTDLNFFSPGSTSSQKQRPVVTAVGLEQRDYRTLAAATADLLVDVRISGFSRDAQTLKQAFPKVMPGNMSCQFYEWPDLLQLYRDTDIAIVSTFPNRYAAGVQVMMEAMACGCPTVVSCTEGLCSYLSGNDGVIPIPPGDALAMRQAIVRLLEQPQEAERLSRKALMLAKERHDSDVHVERLAQNLENLPRLRPQFVGWG